MNGFQRKEAQPVVDNRMDFIGELKALGADAPPGTFEGYASMFGVVDQGGDQVEKGAFSESLEQNKNLGRLIPMLWQHDRAEPIGVWEDIREDAKGLKVRGRLLVDDDPLARRAYAHINAGSIGGLSIGYRVVDAAPHPKRQNVFMLRKLDLREISVVTLPMLLQARVTDVKDQTRFGRMPTVRDFEAFLRDAGGFSNSKAKHIANLAAPALHRDGAGDGANVDELMLALARRLGV
jgi:HK97 family phage prohead protease